MKDSSKKTRTTRLLGKRGGRPSTYSETQDDWLREQLPTYTAAQGKGLADFWGPLFEEYFEKWPVEEPTDGTAEERKSLSDKRWKDAKKASVSTYR